MRSLRKAARNVAAFRWPRGALSTRRSPFGAQPRSGVMLVFVQSWPREGEGLIDEDETPGIDEPR